MNKLIEADFFPRNSGDQWRQAHLSAGSRLKETRRILIVDDDPDSTHLVKILLEKAGGYVVLEENVASKAHQTAQSFRPDLILLDIMMPEMDGGDVAAQIEADPELQGTPIVFLSALVTRAEAKSGLSIQGHPFLAKPISIPELINVIKEHFPLVTATLTARTFQSLGLARTAS
jgi:two-component system OmpR family response regulator